MVIHWVKWESVLYKVERAGPLLEWPGLVRLNIEFLLLPYFRHQRLQPLLYILIVEADNKERNEKGPLI